MSLTVLSTFLPAFSAGPLPISLSCPVTSSTFSPAFCIGPRSHPVRQKPTTRLAMTADTALRCFIRSPPHGPRRGARVMFDSSVTVHARDVPPRASFQVGVVQGFRGVGEPMEKKSRRMRSAGGAMDGVHDLGGMHGFGPVEREENEPPFHGRWEAA